MADITSNLLHYYALDDNTGTSADDQGSANVNGSLLGTTGVPTWTAPGKVGTSHLSFVAANLQYVAIPGSETGEGITGAMTIAAWVKFSTISVEEHFFSKSAGAGSRSWCLLLTTTNGFEMRVSSDGTAQTTVASTTGIVSTGVWYHVTGVYTPSTSLKLYVNGGATQTAENTTSIPASQDTSNAVLGNIGRRPSNASYVNGEIDEVRQYTRALAAADVTELYNYPPAAGGKKITALMAAGHF